MANSNSILNKINFGYITDIPSFITDIPGMRLANNIGRYSITTERRDKVKEKEDETIKRNHYFHIIIKPREYTELEDKRTKKREDIEKETLTTKSFARAVKTHYAIVAYLNRIYPR